MVGMHFGPQATLFGGDYQFGPSLAALAHSALTMFFEPHEGRTKIQKGPFRTFLLKKKCCSNGPAVSDGALLYDTNEQ